MDNVDCRPFPAIEIPELTVKSTEDERSECCRWLIDFVPEYLRSDVIDLVRNFKFNSLKERLIAAAERGRNECSHAAIVELLAPKLSKRYAPAFQKTPTCYHDLLLSVFRSSAEDPKSQYKKHLPWFLEEVVLLGFPRAFLSSLEEPNNLKLDELILTRPSESDGHPSGQETKRDARRDVEKMLLSTLATTSNVRVLVLAAKWLPHFVEGEDGKLESISMLQEHCDQHVGCIGALHNLLAKPGSKVSTKFLWNALQSPDWDRSIRINWGPFSGRLQRVILNVISAEIDASENMDVMDDICIKVSDKWRRQISSVSRSDRKVVEDSLVSLYKAAGVAPPRTVLWFENPRSASIAAVSYAKQITNEDKSEYSTWVATDEREYKQWSQVEAYYQRIARMVSQIPKPRDWLQSWNWFYRRSVPDEYDIIERSSDQTALTGQKWGFFERLVSRERLLTVGYRSFLEAIGICGDSNDGLGDILLNSGGFFAFDEVAFVVERPSQLRRDKRGRIHSANGKAIEYSDGWGLYAWKGVAVSEDLILHPEKLTLERIDAERDPNLRWSMIDIYGIERYLRDSKLAPHDQSRFGSLYIVTPAKAFWPSLAVLEVTNRSPEPDGSFKSYFIGVPPINFIGLSSMTARDAVAWTFGMDGMEYDPVVET